MEPERPSATKEPTQAEATGLPSWYESALEKASSVAQKLPLVRVAVPRASARRETELIDVLRSGTFKLDHKSPRARDKEIGLGFVDRSCLYFHGGRTHPDYGQLIVVLEDVASDTPIEASPSGLGSMLCGAAWSDPLEVHDGCLAPVAHASEEEQKLHYARTNWPGDWREQAAGFLAKYFGNQGLGRYFANEEHGRPDVDDPAHVFHNPNVKDWRAWTIEIRAMNDVNLVDALDQGRLLWWAISPNLRSHIEEREAEGEEFPFYERLCNKGSEYEIKGEYEDGSDLFALADKEVMKRLDL